MRIGARHGAVAALAALTVALAPGCAQVRRVGEGDDAAGTKSEERRSPSATAAPKRAPGQPSRDGKPALPATPNGLISDGAARQIKEQLHRRGFLENPSPGSELDARTSDALRRFQESEQIAATGFPDQETLRRLNVSTDEAFQSAPEETRGENGN